MLVFKVIGNNFMAVRDTGSWDFIMKKINILRKRLSRLNHSQCKIECDNCSASLSKQVA